MGGEYGNPESFIKSIADQYLPLNEYPRQIVDYYILDVSIILVILCAHQYGVHSVFRVMHSWILLMRFIASCPVRHVLCYRRAMAILLDMTLLITW